MKTSSLFRRVLYFGCTRPELFYFFTGRNCNGSQCRPSMMFVVITSPRSVQLWPLKTVKDIPIFFVGEQIIEPRVHYFLTRTHTFCHTQWRIVSHVASLSQMRALDYSISFIAAMPSRNINCIICIISLWNPSIYLIHQRSLSWASELWENI